MINFPNHTIRLFLIITVLWYCSEADAQTNYAGKVNGLIGSKGKGVSETELQYEAGFTFPGALYPFGMVQFTPTFFAPDKGFVVNQLSGAGCPHMGNFPTLPLKGKLNFSPNTMKGLNPSNTTDKSVAGHYKTTLSSGIVCDLTVTARTGIARFDYPSVEKTGTVVIGSGISANDISKAIITVTSPTSCEGYADGGSFCGSATGYTVYFVAEFDQNAISSGTWEADQLSPGKKTASGANSGAYFTFDVSSGKPVQYKFAISYVSVENARKNLKAENPGFNFDKTKSEAMSEWNKYLSRIEVKGGSDDQQTLFYTSLYHALVHPNVFNDVNGQYMGSDNKVYKTKKGSNYYTAFSNWDTYRTQTQLLALLVPEIASDIVKSHVEFAERSGGGFPRWVLANVETGIMQGDPSAIVVANAYAFGARDFDHAAALKVMRRGAEVPGTRSQTIETRPSLAQYLNKGYMNASIQLEYTSADFAIGQFALQAFGNKELYETYLKRAQLWKNLLHPETKWLNSRNDDGSWKLFNYDWREATYNSYFWMVPYNLKTLIDTIGGKEIAEHRLDSLFIKVNATYHDDWFAAGNEPDFQVPWIYNWTGSPYKTQTLVRRILKESYQNKANGLPGNDDLGAMGAWYVFASLGMYPMIPGVGGFTLNSPVFSDIKIHYGNGKTLNISGGSDKNHYVSSLRVEGKEWESTWIPFEEIKNGGQIDFTLTAQPDFKWGKSVSPPSFNK